ncbi:hypothetical protein [Pseudomonas fluorescens]|uniref:hypothetical protein n=1 Tax=Pseudomonas fluorescens TaxID=294 RepID=UPI00259B6A94|nr:hypothetical protein [Pseudomonas fluorescens]WJK11433.1 hypothetical protein QR290_08815 [Pseudomonas fluorescens]
MNSPVSPSGSATNQQVQIFPPPSGGIGALALSPFYITNHKPQPNGAMGVNVAMANSDLSGLLAWILPYVNMSIGDVIHVLLAPHPLPVAEITVGPEHFNDQGEAQPISFYISLSDLEFSFAPNSLTSLEGKIVVKRISDNSEESSPVGVLYKYPPPGPQDPDASTARNEAMSKPIVTDLVLDQTVIDNGTWVLIPQYPNQCIGDVVTVAFGPLLVSVTITAIGDVSIEIPAALLATLKPTDNLAVSWSVNDIVENFSKWSLPTPVKVIPGQSLLAAPFWDEADTENVLNHDLLLGSDTTVTATAVFAAKDRIDLSVEGHTSTGEVIVYTDSRTRTTAGRTQIFDIPNEFIRNTIGGELRAFFTVTKGTVTQQSKPADAIIIGTSQPLGLPTVTPLNAAGEVPEDAPTVAVEFAKYWPLKLGAKALCYWQTLSEAGTVTLQIFQQIITDEKLPIIFQIVNKFVAPYAGGPLSVKCEIKTPGEATVSSDLLQLQISAKKVITIDAPTQVPKGTIDPLDGNWGMRAEYLGVQEGQMGRLRQANAPIGDTSFPRLPFNQNKRINWPLDRSFLIRHQGETIKLFWNLWFNERLASSPTTDVVIAAIQPEDNRFPTVTVAGVTAAQLNVNTLKPSDMLNVPAWLHQAIGQLIWLRLEGVDSLGSKVVLELVVGERITSVDGYGTLIPLEWLKGLKNQSELNIRCQVSFSGKTDEQSKVLFPVRRYQIQSVPALSAGPNKSVALTNFVVAEGRPPAYPPSSATFTQLATGGTAPISYSCKIQQSQRSRLREGQSHAEPMDQHKSSPLMPLVTVRLTRCM